MHLSHVQRRALLVLAVGAVLVPVLAPADVVEEQRSRLPPPAQCSDPVAGTWMSHTFYPHVSEWYVFQLFVQRVPTSPNLLTGSMHAQFWSGSTATPEPPPCGPGAYRRAVDEPARGTYEASGRVVFEGTSWTSSANGGCDEVPAGSYSLDHFSGTIDPARQEFQSVLNAPGWVNVPTLFRRVRCTDGTVTTPVVPPPPPPFVPPPPPALPGAGGCGCGGLLGGR